MNAVRDTARIILVACIATLTLASAEASWTHLGFDTENIQGLSSNGEYVFVLVQDADFWDRSLWRVPIDGSTTPELILDYPSASPWVVACHPLEPDTVYVGVASDQPLQQAMLVRSVDGGSTFQPYIDGFCAHDGGVRILSATATSPSYLTACPDDVIYTTTSGFGSWSPISGSGPEGCMCGDWCAHQLDVVRSGVNPDVFWQIDETICQGTAIFKTENAGQTWQEMLSDCNAAFRLLELDGDDPDRVYFGYGLDRRLSTDGGDTWTEDAFPLVDELVVDGTDARILYGVTRVGPVVVTSGSRGVLWNSEDVSGLPTDGEPIGGFTADAAINGQLFIGYQGGSGLFTKQVNVAVVGVSESAPVSAPLTVAVRPNPFRTETWISIDGEDGTTPVEIYDSAGRQVANLPSAGSGRWYWDGSNARGEAVAPGVYHAKFKGANGSHSLRLIKSH